MVRFCPKYHSACLCVWSFATGLRAAAKSGSDSEGLWEARNLAFLTSQLFAACSTTCRELLELAILMTEEIAFLLVFSTPYSR